MSENKTYTEKITQGCLVAAMVISIAQCAFGQGYAWKSQLKKAIAPCSMAVVSGAAGGLREGLHFRRVEFFRAFPNAKRAYWDTNISSAVKPKFFGAARDAYHDLQYLHTGMLYLSGAWAGINVSAPYFRKEKRPVWHRIADVAIQGAAGLVGYVIGSRAVYDIILKKR